jgi:hypothetical protein
MCGLRSFKRLGTVSHLVYLCEGTGMQLLGEGPYSTKRSGPHTELVRSSVGVRVACEGRNDLQVLRPPKTEVPNQVTTKKVMKRNDMGGDFITMVSKPAAKYHTRRNMVVSVG